MAEMTHTEVVYASRSIQLLRSIVNWFAFLCQIFVQMLRAVGRPLLFCSSSSSSNAAADGFKPLPAVELREMAAAEPPASVEICGGGEAEKLTVVLDLDETLVCAYETSSLSPFLRSQAIEAGLKWFKLDCISPNKGFEGKPKIINVTVFERPGLREFLMQLSQFANLVLFTAGLEGYARPLMDRIDTESVFSLQLYRPSTVSTKYRNHVKDLTCISKNMCRTVIVDNSPYSFLLQPQNGIPCLPFSAGQPHDSQLLDVILPLLKDLSGHEDVRPVLNEKFGMPDWFEKHGIPVSCWLK